MAEQPTIPDAGTGNGESKLFGVSVRGWLAVLIIATVCILSFFRVKVEEPLYSLVLVTSAFYFGQSKK